MGNWSFKHRNTARVHVQNSSTSVKFTGAKNLEKEGSAEGTDYMVSHTPHYLSAVACGLQSQPSLLNIVLLHSFVESNSRKNSKF